LSRLCRVSILASTRQLSRPTESRNSRASRTSSLQEGKEQGGRQLRGVPNLWESVT
jgi:hypothetical protein